uniref:Uncharacterized protein n=1 Tax=Oryza punctata TaxID=4537 RepID=A0A0E0LZ60_ORYPU
MMLMLIVAHVRDTIICNHLAIKEMPQTINVKCDCEKHINVVADDNSDEMFIELQGSYLPGRNKYNKIYKISNRCTTMVVEPATPIWDLGATFLN